MAERLKDIKNISRKICRDTVVKRFSQDRMVKEYIEVYNEIINK